MIEGYVSSCSLLTNTMNRLVTVPIILDDVERKLVIVVVYFEIIVPVWCCRRNAVSKMLLGGMTKPIT